MPHVPLVSVELGAAAVAVKCFVPAKICVVGVTLVSMFLQTTQAGKLLLALAAEVRSGCPPKQVAHLEGLAEARKCYQELGEAAELVTLDHEAQVTAEEDGQGYVASLKAQALGTGRRGAQRGPDERQALISQGYHSLLEDQGQCLLNRREGIWAGQGDPRT